MLLSSLGYGLIDLPVYIISDLKINSWIIKEKIYDHRRHIDVETWPKLRYKHFHTKAIFVCAPKKCKGLKAQNNLNFYTSDLLDKSKFRKDRNFNKRA